MSFKGAMRAYLFSNSGVATAVSDTGSFVSKIDDGGTTVSVTVGFLNSTPPTTGQLLLKNNAGSYELINYTSRDSFGGQWSFVTSATLQQSYALEDYVAVALGIYSFPAPQEADLPYILLQRITTTEIYNRLNSQGTICVEQWQASCYASTDESCETIKDAVVSALNSVNPTTWSDDGFATSYTVETSVFESETTIPELKDDGSQNYITHKPITFTVIRSISAS